MKRKYGDAGESPYKMNLNDIDYYERMVRYHEGTGKIILELVSQHKIPKRSRMKRKRDFRVPFPAQGRINSSRATTSILSSSSLIPRKAMFDRYVNDERAQSILATLSYAPWWKYDLATLTEEELAQTMVNWIRHRANEPPIPLIHPRSRGGK